MSAMLFPTTGASSTDMARSCKGTWNGRRTDAGLRPAG